MVLTNNIAIFFNANLMNTLQDNFRLKKFIDD